MKIYRVDVEYLDGSGSIRTIIKHLTRKELQVFMPLTLPEGSDLVTLKITLHQPAYGGAND